MCLTAAAREQSLLLWLKSHGRLEILSQNVWLQSFIAPALGNTLSPFPLCLLSLLCLQGDANRSYSDDDHSSSNFDESEKHDSIKLSGELCSSHPGNISILVFAGSGLSWFKITNPSTTGGELIFRSEHVSETETGKEDKKGSPDVPLPRNLFFCSFWGSWGIPKPDEVYNLSSVFLIYPGISNQTCSVKLQTKKNSPEASRSDSWTTSTG